LDPNLCESALQKSIELTLQICPGAHVASKIADEKDFHLATGPINLEWEFFDKKIGVKIDHKEIVGILKRLGFEIKEKKSGLSVKVPTWRATKDISIPEDLVEEVARIYGYDNIKTELPMFSITPPEQNQSRLLERKIKDLLALEHGFSEVYNYSFVSPITIEKLGIDTTDLIELDNPVAKDRPYLRHNLWTGLLETMEKNLHQFSPVKIFEIGKVFIKNKPGMRVKENSDELLPAQPTYLGLAYAEKGVDNPFYVVSEAVVSMLCKLGCKAELKPAEHELGKFIHAGRQAQVLVNGVGIGAICEVSPSSAERLGLESRVAVVELDLDTLLPFVSDNIPASSAGRQYHKISQYPSIVRDIAFVIKKSVQHADIVSALQAIDPLIRSIELFDVFEGANIGEGKKSLAYHITYRSDDKTLESGEVDKVHGKVFEVIEDKLGGEVRK